MGGAGEPRPDGQSGHLSACKGESGAAQAERISLEQRALAEANDWVVIRGAFADAAAIEALSRDLACFYPLQPLLWRMVAAELRRRAAYIRSLGGLSRASSG
jgi:hypothetical protein